MDKIYVTGDIHGQTSDLYGCSAQEGDYVIVLGDCGIPFGYSNPNFKTAQFERDCEFLRKQPFNIIFIGGNHDDYDYIETLPRITAFSNDNVRQMIYKSKYIPGRDFTLPNVYYIDAPGVYTIAGKRCLIIPGADSHDIQDGILDANDPDLLDQINRMHKNWKFFFRIAHWTWWEQEKIDTDYIESNLDLLATEKFDYIFTHECPTVYMRHMRCNYPVNNGEEMLQKIFDTLTFGYWFHGHMHQDVIYSHNIACLYYTLADINKITALMDKYNGSPYLIDYWYLDGLSEEED